MNRQDKCTRECEGEREWESERKNERKRKETKKRDNKKGWLDFSKALANEVEPIMVRSSKDTNTNTHPASELSYFNALENICQS